ncbi:MAG: hypothetical protein IT285_15545 [Bdellovibrionales bacterium]|nr:hypothetical protein [Bdellovibrionales bacterium]
MKTSLGIGRQWFVLASSACISLGFSAAAYAATAEAAPRLKAVAERAVFQSNFDFAEAKWERVSNEDADIQVYRWKAPGKDLFAFKGVAIVQAPMPRLVGIIADTQRQNEWVPDLGEARMVEQVSALERIQYLHFETPFVTKDRDFVVGTRASFEADTRTMLLDFASTVDPRLPKTDKVRGRILRGQYLLKALDGGESTQVTIQVYLDPMGSVPHWLVNATQVGFPRRTLTALRKQAQKDDVREHPLARAAMNGLFRTPTELQAWLNANPAASTF